MSFNKRIREIYFSFSYVGKLILITHQVNIGWFNRKIFTHLLLALLNDLLLISQ